MKFFILFSFLLTLSSASILKKTEATPISILKCSGGNLTGAQNFVALFRTILDHCETLRDTTKNLYGCVTENLGITEEDGTPNLSKMNDMYVTIFSEMVIEDIPDFKEELTQCGQVYVSDFNGIYEAADSAESYLKCFMSAVQNFSESIENVCKLEEQINGKYFVTD